MKGKCFTKSCSTKYWLSMQPQVEINLTNMREKRTYPTKYWFQLTTWPCTMSHKAKYRYCESNSPTHEWFRLTFAHQWFSLWNTLQNTFEAARISSHMVHGSTSMNQQGNKSERIGDSKRCMDWIHSLFNQRLLMYNVERLKIDGFLRMFITGRQLLLASKSLEMSGLIRFSGKSSSTKTISVVLLTLIPVP